MVIARSLFSRYFRLRFFVNANGEKEEKKAKKISPGKKRPIYWLSADQVLVPSTFVGPSSLSLSLLIGKRTAKWSARSDERTNANFFPPPSLPFSLLFSFYRERRRSALSRGCDAAVDRLRRRPITDQAFVRSFGQAGKGEEATDTHSMRSCSNSAPKKKGEGRGRGRRKRESRSLVEQPINSELRRRGKSNEEEERKLSSYFLRQWLDSLARSLAQRVWVRLGPAEGTKREVESHHFLSFQSDPEKKVLFLSNRFLCQLFSSFFLSFFLFSCTLSYS